MILIAFGTRPEIIKLYPVIEELTTRKIEFKTVFTGQHLDLYNDVKNLIPAPDFSLDIMTTHKGLNSVVSGIIHEVDLLLDQVKPDLVIVQGDTSTVIAVALAAFYRGIKVGHIEAGMRTYDISSPFPEEANRQIVSRISHFNWAPTQRSVDNLNREGISNALLTGNTVVDACKKFSFEIKYENKVLVTLHRRENFGPKMESLFDQIELLANHYPHLDFLFPMHPNPNIQKLKNRFKKVQILPPLKYIDFLKELASCLLIITDSGGVQEESGAFGKKVLVCRNTTERPEGIEAGFAKLVDSEIIENFEWAYNNPRWTGENPYGDGYASKNIVESIIDSGIL